MKGTPVTDYRARRRAEGCRGAPRGLDRPRRPVNAQLDGSLHFADQIKTGTAEVRTQLRRAGVKPIVMLTGDNAESASAVAGAIGIPTFEPISCPKTRSRHVEALQREGLVVAMLGDGVNDAPARARADVGIAMGGRGSQAAIAAADIALMTDDLQKIVTARLLARCSTSTLSGSWSRPVRKGTAGSSS